VLDNLLTRHYTQCDGVRPACVQCRQRGTECVYLAASKDETHTTILKRHIESLEQELKDYADILGHLTTLPEEDAVELLRLLKSTANPRNVLAIIKGSAHSTHRQHTAARGVLPATHSGVSLS
jgi:hypothetical protein